MGMSLTEIKSLVDERRAGRNGHAKMLVMMEAHRDQLVQRSTDLKKLIKFVDAKIAWLRAGAQGPMPEPPP
jgi:DNA-binding transcriptional MerR regulator